MNSKPKIPHHKLIYGFPIDNTYEKKINSYAMFRETNEKSLFQIYSLPMYGKYIGQQFIGFQYGQVNSYAMFQRN